MAKFSRTKGRRWELEVARLLEEATDRKFSVVLTECRDGNIGDIETEFPLTIQCKVGKAPSIWKAVKEAVDAKRPKDWAVAIVRRNQQAGRPKQDVAVLPLDDFLDIVARLAIT